jgi:hypothetical protein
MALLQIYQLTEFLICIGVDQNITGRIAFTAITLLPPMGHFMSAKLIGWKYKDYWVSFALGIAYSIFYIFAPKSVELVDCNPLYAIYSYPYPILYGMYYFGILFYSIALIVLHMIKNRKKESKKTNLWTILGYSTFLIPMGIMVFLVNVDFGTAIPSIMCKYAILVAIILFIYSFQKEAKINPV